MPEPGPLRKIFDRIDSRIRAAIEAPGLRRLEKYFDDLLYELENADLEIQVCASLEMRTMWHAFIVKYGDIDAFINEPHSVREDYLWKYQSMIEAVERDEKLGTAPPGSTLGAMLTHAYISAVAWNNSALVNKIADSLDPYNRLAYEIGNSDGEV